MSDDIKLVAEIVRLRALLKRAVAWIKDYGKLEPECSCLKCLDARALRAEIEKEIGT